MKRSTQRCRAFAGPGPFRGQAKRNLARRRLSERAAGQRSTALLIRCRRCARQSPGTRVRHVEGERLTDGATQVLCPNTTLSGVAMLAERLREKIADAVFPAVSTITASIGVA